MTTAADIITYQKEEQNVTTEDRVEHIINRIKEEIKKDPFIMEYFIDEDYISNDISDMLKNRGFTLISSWIFYPNIKEKRIGYIIKWDE